jgi:hypothetical protein
MAQTASMACWKKKQQHAEAGNPQKNLLSNNKATMSRERNTMSLQP